MKERIFLLATKKSKKRPSTTYCIGVFKLGTKNMEFILGETDNDKQYVTGDEVSYIYHADYVYSIQDAVNWLNEVE